MRAAFEVGLLLGVVGLSAAFAASGCDYTCEVEYGELKCESGSTGSTSGGPCDPTTSAEAVDETCGIFVRASAPGDDSNTGRKAEPVKTIAKAIERWKTNGKNPNVYVCAEQFDEIETVEIPAGLSLYGGLDCNAMGDSAWKYVPPATATSETVITTPEGTIPLHVLPSVETSATTVLRDVHVIARTVPDTMPGVSSIAVLAEEANLELVRLLLQTGDGAKGEDGAPYDMPAQAGVDGGDGKAACDMAAFVETDGPMNTCSAGVDSKGGVGAGGNLSSISPPTAGTPGPDNAGTSESTGMLCTAGKDGTSPLQAETGEPATGVGTLDRTVGYIGVPGNSGATGAIGQGGGGGGGTRSKPGATNLCGSSLPGASGGSGGTGGCGGAGGQAGGYGGSSIAVVSVKSTVKLTQTRMNVGNGGAPGLGSSGQVGGAGGKGGTGGAGKMGVAGACNGGSGGKGGDGGPGSNGLGGHAIGVAYSDAEPTLDETSIVGSIGKPGAGGQSAPMYQIPAAQ